MPGSLRAKNAGSPHKQGPSPALHSDGAQRAAEGPLRRANQGAQGRVDGLLVRVGRRRKERRDSSLAHWRRAARSWRARRRHHERHLTPRTRIDPLREGRRPQRLLSRGNRASKVAALVRITFYAEKLLVGATAENPQIPSSSCDFLKLRGA